MDTKETTISIPLAVAAGYALSISVPTLLGVPFAVVLSEPTGGDGLTGFAVHLDSLNAYVVRLVMCDVSLWNYVGAFIAVSIPTRNGTEDCCQSPPPAGPPTGEPSSAALAWRWNDPGLQELPSGDAALMASRSQGDASR